jgi:hypothetical protein
MGIFIVGIIASCTCLFLVCWRAARWARRLIYRRRIWLRLKEIKARAEPLDARNSASCFLR